MLDFCHSKLVKSFLLSTMKTKFKNCITVCMHACICTCMSSLRMLENSLELELLQRIVNHHVGAVNQSQVLSKTSKCSFTDTWYSLSHKIFLKFHLPLVVFCLQLGLTHWLIQLAYHPVCDSQHWHPDRTSTSNHLPKHFEGSTRDFWLAYNALSRVCNLAAPTPSFKSMKKLSSVLFKDQSTASHTGCTVGTDPFACSRIHWHTRWSPWVSALNIVARISAQMRARGQNGGKHSFHLGWIILIQIVLLQLNWSEVEEREHIHVTRFCFFPSGALVAPCPTRHLLCGEEHPNNFLTRFPCSWACDEGTLLSICSSSPVGH